MERIEWSCFGDAAELGRVASLNFQFDQGQRMKKRRAYTGFPRARYLNNIRASSGMFGIDIDDVRRVVVLQAVKYDGGGFFLHMGVG